MFGKLDRYVMRKLLAGIALWTLVMIIVSVVVDFTEKINKLVGAGVPFLEVLGYYLAFAPHMMTLFGPIAVYIGVIFATSRMAYKSEIIAVIGNGVSFYRWLRPYAVISVALVIISALAFHYAVPISNKYRLAFEDIYIHTITRSLNKIELVIDKSDKHEINVSLHRYDPDRFQAVNMNLRVFEDYRLKRSLFASRIVWDTSRQEWRLGQYIERVITDGGEEIRHRQAKDTNLGFTPDDFERRLEYRESLTTPELLAYIDRERVKGNDQIPFFQVQLYLRSAMPVSLLILTMIGVAFSSRKVRGGTGAQIGLGLALSAIFLFTMRFASTFATNAGVDPEMAVWFPNVLFGILAIFALRLAPK